MNQNILLQRKRLLLFRMLVILLGATMTVFVYVFTSWQQNDQALQEIQMTSHQRNINIADAVASRLADLESLNAILQQPTSAQQQSLFENQASIIMRHNIDIEALYWSPLTPADKTESHEAFARKLNIIDYKIHQNSQDNDKNGASLKPATKDNYYLPILYRHQRYQGLNASGFDMLSEPQFRDTILKTIDTQALATAPAYTTIEQDNRTKVVWLFSPVFSSNNNKQFLGLVSLKINFGEFIGNSISVLSATPVPIQIYDLSDHSKIPLFQWPENDVFSGLATLNPSNTNSIAVFDREMTVINVATERYLRNFQNDLPLWLALLSLFCSSVVYFTIRIMQNKAETLYDESNQRFWQLEQTNKTLNNKVIEKSTFEKSHKDLQERINDYISLSEDYFWDLDADLHYTYVSKKCVNITGFPVTSLIGSAFTDNIHEDDIKQFEDVIKRAILRKKSLSMEIRNLTHNNRWRIERIHIKAVFDKADDCIGFRGVSRDLGKVMEEEEVLEETPLLNSAFSGRRLNDRVPGVAFGDEQSQSSDDYKALIANFIQQHDKTLDEVQSAFFQDHYENICESMHRLEKSAAQLGSTAIVEAATALRSAASENQSKDEVESKIAALEEHLGPAIFNFKKRTLYASD